MRTIHLLQPALLLTLVGCCSVSSTHVERDKASCGWKTTHLHGLPVTLEVPHRFKVSIIDTFYEKSGNVLRDTSCVAPGMVPPALKTRSVEVTVENTKEIFTVDFVRPAAGTLKTNAQLNAERQYFTSIDNKIEDKTIQDITTAIGTLSGAISSLPKNRALTEDPTVNKLPRVVAVAVVEIADPSALEKIHDFLCLHLNGCNTCVPAPLSPPPVISTGSNPVTPPAPPQVAPVAPPTPAGPLPAPRLVPAPAPGH